MKESEFLGKLANYPLPVGIPTRTLHNPLNPFANTRTSLEPPAQEKVRPEALPGLVFLQLLRS